MLTDGWTDRETFANLKLLSELKTMSLGWLLNEVKSDFKLQNKIVVQLLSVFVFWKIV